MTTAQLPFDVGDTVEWVSQAGASPKRKVGTVHAIIAAGKRPQDYGVRGDFGSPRPYASYLVRVPTPGGRSHRFYWPHASLLSLVTRAIVPASEPTPASSLEEAREAVINAALLPFTPAGEPLRAYVMERVDKLEAAALAEVIREVEALLGTPIAQSVLANYKTRGAAGVADYLERDWGSDEADVEAFASTLRALFQGGEV